MTMTGEKLVAAAGIAGDFEFASAETSTKEKIKNKTRNEGSMRCTATGNLPQYR
jgi:hypothetical protein